jgi:4a-hydroxytetrahydrobiopterin dehydratase
MAAKLTDMERQSALGGLPGWRFDEKTNALVKEFKFPTFVEAFGFMARVALLVQAADHHPDWSNSYNRVTVGFSTHDAGGVTAKDAELAGKVEALQRS